MAGTGSLDRDLVVLMLLGGGLALGLPHVTARDRRRFWHPWVNAGLLPLLVGLAIGPALGGWITPATAAKLRPFLAVALTAAGVLLGSQLKPAYLGAAGRDFLVRHTRSALLVFALALAAGVLLAAPVVAGPAIPALAGVIAALCVASSQRPPRLHDPAERSKVLFGHVVPSGWWNLVALILGGLALGIGDHPGQAWGWLVALALPAGLGLLLGRAATAATSRAEAFLLLPAVLALAGGVALLLGWSPLITGLLVGAVLSNVGAGRVALVERAFDELEQPIVLATGLLAGLCLLPVATAPAAWVVVAVIPLRWLLRRRWSPTDHDLGRAQDRAWAPTGAAGVLLLASATVAPEPLPSLVIPLTLACAVATLIADVVERRR